MADIKNETNSYFLAGDWSQSSASVNNSRWATVSTVKAASGSVKSATGASVLSTNTGITFSYSGSGFLATTSNLTGITSVKAEYNGTAANVEVIYDISVEVAFSCSSSVAIVVKNYGFSGQTIASGKITFKEYGVSTGYDTTAVTEGKVEIYNESFAEKVDKNSCNFGNLDVTNETSSTGVTDIITEIKSNSSGAATTINDNGEVVVTIGEGENQVSYVVGSDEEISSVADAITAATVGFGTANHPYLIYDEDDFDQIYINTSTADCIYYRLENDIKTTESLYYKPNNGIINTSFVLDGNNKTITGWFEFDESEIDVTLKNIVFDTYSFGVYLDAIGTITLENCTFNNYENNYLEADVILLDMQEIVIKDCTFNNERVTIYAANFFAKSTQSNLPITITGTTFSGTETFDTYSHVSSDSAKPGCIVIRLGNTKKYYSNVSTFNVNVTMQNCEFEGEIKYAVYYESRSLSGVTDKYNFTLKSVTFASTFDCLNSMENDWIHYTDGTYSDYICPAFIYDASSWKYDSTNTTYYIDESVYTNRLSVTSDENCTFTWKLNSTNNDTGYTYTINIDANINIYNNKISSYTENFDAIKNK